ncbi:DUF2878 domain-containing protein [Pseudoalteromonas luteoviolacea]|uniref:DUF2878 domain-containing protein n=1 Tax=Pseudoalteromonas luteoviolacea DSM 6061 TaxID=1365250 RepID=A0A166X1X6_9GAMM|nr:DUF2878 domain-containing protein [Pseudoalteromonas luteoviolacea]KZN39150.1 hypothetical protein N475_15165 [Pseudoalteromonas luteoviolacea DSM 6061]MBE0390044.1 hypothetical protein [Pseudoalteromonas luteoviolacea DSM 6061]
MMRKYSVVINFALFQAAWFAVFFLQEQGMLVVALAISCMVALSPDKKNDCRFVLIGLVVAVSIEAVASGLGIIRYEGGWIPVWLIFLWAALLFSFRESLAKLFVLTLPTRLLLVWLGAPGSYYAGQQVGLLLTIEPVWLFWVSYGGLWFCGFEVLRWLDKHPKIRREIGTSELVRTH